MALGLAVDQATITEYIERVNRFYQGVIARQEQMAKLVPETNQGLTNQEPVVETVETMGSPEIPVEAMQEVQDPITSTIVPPEIVDTIIEEDIMKDPMMTETLDTTTMELDDIDLDALINGITLDDSTLNV